MRPVEDERAQLVVAPCAPVRLLEAIPDHYVLLERYPNPERPAAYLAADTSQNGDLTVEIVVVVVGGWIAEQAGRGQIDLFGRKTDVSAGKIRLAFLRREG